MGFSKTADKGSPNFDELRTCRSRAFHPAGERSFIIFVNVRMEGLQRRCPVHIEKIERVCQAQNKRLMVFAPEKLMYATFNFST